MRRVLALISVLLALVVQGACAEGKGVEEIVNGMEFGEIQEFADSADEKISVRETVLKLASGEFSQDIESALAEVKNALLSGLRDAVGMLSGIVAPAMISAVAVQMLGGSPGATAAQYVCRLSCAAVLTGAFFRRMDVAGALIRNLAGLSDAVFPLLTGLLSATGASSAAAMLSPAAALFAEGISKAAAGWGMRLAAVAAGLAVAGNLNANLSLKRLFSLTRGVVNFSAGAAMTVFLALLSVQGTLAAGYDNLSVRTARYAVDSIIPVIGGEVADTLDALISSTLLVKSALGVTGMLITLSICVRPVAALLATTLAMRLASAAMEPVADPFLTRMTEQFARAAEMLLVVCVTVVMMLLLMLGATVRAGGGLVR